VDPNPQILKEVQSLRAEREAMMASLEEERKKGTHVREGVGRMETDNKQLQEALRKTNEDARKMEHEVRTRRSAFFLSTGLSSA